MKWTPLALILFSAIACEGAGTDPDDPRAGDVSGKNDDTFIADGDEAEADGETDKDTESTGDEETTTDDDKDADDVVEDEDDEDGDESPDNTGDKPIPGIMMNGDPELDSCGWSECIPLCQTVALGDGDPDYPDWGYEDGHSCVIPDSPTATELPVDSSWYPHGTAPAPRSCLWGAPEVDLYAPPSVNGTFTTDGDQILDPNGEPFVIRGINNLHSWFDICGQYAAYEALDNIADTGANAVRVAWAFENVGENKVIGTNPDLLAEILHRIVELKMVPMVVPNDTTGKTDNAGTMSPLGMAQFYTSDGYLEVLKAYESYIMIGLGNEWNGGDSRNENDPEYWVDAYNEAIHHIRSHGIKSPIVITANEWGQGCTTILLDAEKLDDDNLIFDVHTYNYFFSDTTNRARGDGLAKSKVRCLNEAKKKGIPLIVGEFGHEHGGVPVDLSFLDTAIDNGQGYFAWAWFGDTEYPVLDMNNSWEGPLTKWGEDAVSWTSEGAETSSIF